jgi:hypothetical protein
VKVAFVVMLAAVVAAGCAASASHGSDRAALCMGTQLHATFNAVRGSEGAGNIVYTLVVTNHSTSACNVTGLPRLVLLNKTGKALPTHVRAAFPQGLTAVLVTLAPGKSAKATARFSPDVNGVGDHAPGICQPVSYWVRVSGPGGGTTKGAIRPPTSVCERGQLSFRAYSHA